MECAPFVKEWGVLNTQLILGTTVYNINPHEHVQDHHGSLYIFLTWYTVPLEWNISPQ